MVRSLTKSPFVLFALGLLICASSPSSAKDKYLPQRRALYEQMLRLSAEGKYEESIPVAEKLVALTKRAEGEDSASTAAELSNLAEAYDNLGQFDKVEPLLKEALAISRKILGPEHPDTAHSLYCLGKMYEDMGDYGKVEPLLKESLAIYQKALGRDNQNTATAFFNLAAFYLNIGDFANAQQTCKEALEIYEKVLGRENLLTVTAIAEMGATYGALRDFAKAGALYKEALDGYQRILGRKNEKAAIMLNNLAGISSRTGDYAKAEPLYKEALEIDREVLGPDSIIKMRAHLDNLGRLYWKMGEYAKAEPLFKEALEICQKTFGPEHPYTAVHMRSLANLQLDLGEIEDARRLIQSSYAIEVKAFSKLLLFGTENQQLAYEDSQPNPYTLFAAMGGSDSFLADAVLHHKAVVLDSLIEERLLAETGQQEANRDLVQQLYAKKRLLAQLSLQATAPSAKEASQRIRALEQEVEEIEDKLARQCTNIGQARRALTITVQQVQAAIPNDAVLVEYVRYIRFLGRGKYEPCYGAILLSAAAPPFWVTLGSANEIEATVNQYQRLVRNAGDDEMAAILGKLYNDVWEPVERMFPVPTNRVIISPDGQLNFLSFATLLNPDKGFVAEKYSIQYVTSGRDLLREPQPTQNKQVLVMANPKFDTDIQLASSDVPTEGAGILRGRKNATLRI